MIKIIQNINPFGFKIYKDSEVYPPKDITNTGSGILIVSYMDNNCSASFPIICGNYKKTTIQFLDEICKLNTGHNSYYEYNDYVNHELYGK